MNKKVLIAIPVCLIGFHGSMQVTAQGACQPMSIPPTCTGNARININTDSKNISPPNLCAEPGQVIEVNVTPSDTSVSIDGKGGGWPSGSGSSFTITAPAVGSYDYNVTFADGTCIDPRIIVRD